MDQGRQHAGEQQDRRGTVSVLNESEPDILRARAADDEQKLVADWIGQTIGSGIEPAETGIFVRSSHQLARARAAVRALGHTQLELSE